MITKVCTAAALAAFMVLTCAGGTGAAPVRLVALGDSLTAGYGLSADNALPAQLERALRKKGIDVTIANAGVSGDTASGGLARLDWSVPAGTQGVIVALGANDAIRGLDPRQTRAALEEIIVRLKRRGIAVLLAGMRAPPSMGEPFVRAFDAIYPSLAAKYGVPLYPFLLQGVAFVPALNQLDGIHPTAAGIAAIAGRMLPQVEGLARRAGARAAARM